MIVLEQDRVQVDLGLKQVYTLTHI